MIEFLFILFVLWFFTSVGAAQHSYVFERTYRHRSRKAARRIAVGTFFKWPYSLFMYIKG